MSRLLNTCGLADSDWASIDVALSDRGVPSSLRMQLRSTLAGKFEGLLLYGSWARGTAGRESDLDILAFNFDGHVNDIAGQVSIARYSASDLADISGTLFGYHLARDGVVLYEDASRLSCALADIKPPVPSMVIERIRSLTPVLDVSVSDRKTYIEGLTKVARYLLRSALYAEAIDQGQPCFSVREIAERKQDPTLTEVLSSHASVRPRASDVVLESLCTRLAEVIGPLEPNSHGDLHGLIEETWHTNRDLSNFATLALSDGSEELQYDELPKVTL